MSNFADIIVATFYAVNPDALAAAEDRIKRERATFRKKSLAWFQCCRGFWKRTGRLASCTLLVGHDGRCFDGEESSGLMVGLFTEREMRAKAFRRETNQKKERLDE